MLKLPCRGLPVLKICCLLCFWLQAHESGEWIWKVDILVRGHFGICGHSIYVENICVSILQNRSKIWKSKSKSCCRQNYLYNFKQKWQLLNKFQGFTWKLLRFTQREYTLAVKINKGTLIDYVRVFLGFFYPCKIESNSTSFFGH